MLRRIRLVIFKKASVKKYVFYSLGEIFLIVVGILIALQINNWNEDIKQKKLEKKTLTEIKAGFKSELEDIKFNINHHQTSTQSGQKILDHFSKQLPYTDSLSHDFAGVLWYARFIVDEGPYETLKSRGLDIISNDTLRKKIIFMYDYRYEAIKSFERNTYLDESYISSIIAKRFDKTQLWAIEENRKFFKGRMAPLNYTHLKQDHEYIHVVKSQIAKNDFLINYFMKPTIQKLEELIAEIENELKRLE